MLWFRQHVLRRRLAAAGQSERGATAVEYGVILTLFVVGIFGAVTFLRGSLNNSYTVAESKIGAPQSTLAPPSLPSWDPDACGVGNWQDPLSGACSPVPNCDPILQDYDGQTNTCVPKPGAPSSSATPTGPTQSPTPSPSDTATVPDTPEAPNGTARNASVELSWTAPNDGGSPIASYSVQYQKAGSPAWVSAGGSVSTSTTVSGLENGASYVFQVLATNGKGSSAWSPSSAAVVPRTVPGPPTNVNGTAGNGSVVLTWVAPLDDGGSAITDYAVQYRVGTNGSWLPFADGTSTSLTATVTGLTNGDDYYFQVAATNAAGTGSYSTPVAGPYTPFAITAPAAPVATCVPGASGQVLVSWTVPGNGGAPIIEYRVQHKRSSQNWGTTPSSQTTTQTSLTITGLTNGTSRDFRVAARNSQGWGADSTVVSCTPANNTAPGAPTNVVGTRAGSQTILVTWNPPASNGGVAIDDYEVQYATYVNSGGNWQTFADGVSTDTSATVTGLNNGTNYYFRVRAHNVVNWGSYSSASPAVSPAAPTVPGAPGTPSGSAASSTAVDLSWSAPSDDGGASVDLYQVQYQYCTSNCQYSWASWTSWTDATPATVASTSTTVTGLTAGRTYRFQVRAHNAIGWGTAWAGPSGNVALVVVTAPGAPTGVSGSAPNGTNGRTRINLSWSAPSDDGGADIDQYQVQYQYCTQYCAYPQWATWTTVWTSATTSPATVTSTSTAVTGLTSGRTYRFQVQAHNSAGWGPWSGTSGNIATNS